MEPIDYMGALRRGWWLLVIFAVLGAGIGLALPTKHSKTNQTTVLWQSQASAGAPPGATSNSPGADIIGAGIPTDQIEFYGQSAQVLETAGKWAGMNKPASQLQGLVSMTGPTTKSGIPGVVQIRGEAPTKKQSVAFTNAFATYLGTYMDARAADKQTYQLAQTQQQIAYLSQQASQLPSSSGAQIASINNQIQALQVKQQQLSGSAPTTGYRVLQPADAHQAVKKVIGKPSKLSTLASNRKVRGLIGLAVGLLVGLAILLAREMMDKRLRSSSRAEGTFGYPVVAEIPSGPRLSGGHGVPVVDVLRDPASPTAEAYRMLRMSVMLEGLAVMPTFDAGSVPRYGNGYVGDPAPEDFGGGSPYTSGPINGGGAAYAGAGTEAGPGNGYARLDAPVRSGPSQHLPAPRSRKVILVVSAGAEQTRPFVAANLAATYAEERQRVLVMSTADLHSRGRVGFSSAPAPEVSASDLQLHVQGSNVDNVARLSWSPFVDVSGQLVTRAPAVLEAARQLADVVIVEVPSLLAVHDGEALASAVDVVLVVGECSSTTSEEARRAGDVLRRIGAPVLGVVLTNVQLQASDVRRLVPQVREDVRRVPA